MSDLNVNISYTPPPMQNNGVHSSQDVTDSSMTRGEFHDAVTAYYNQQLSAGLKEMVSDQQGIPQAKKEIVNASIDSALGTDGVNTNAEGVVLSQEIMAMVDKMADDTLKEAGGEATNKARGGAGNWLVAMASALGKIAGQHLSKMVGIAGEIGALSHTDTAGLTDDTGLGEANDANAKMALEMSTLTAEMSAHGQMYKLVQESTTTAIKTVGEALSSTARKQ